MTDAIPAATVLREDRGAFAILTLNDPARLNPIGDATREELNAALALVMADPAVRVVILTGAGGNFSAGADLRQVQPADAQPDPARSRRRMSHLQSVVRQVIAGPKPVIAAVEGVAFGAGLSLAVACDHVIVAEGARLGAAFGKIGLAPDSAILWTLPQRIGMARTRDLIFTGRPVDAPTALATGMADQCVPKGTALDRAVAKAAEYLDTAPLTIAATKTALAELPGDLETALRIELHQQPLLSGTADHAEARAAFLEKRKPVFTGR